MPYSYPVFQCYMLKNGKAWYAKSRVLHVGVQTTPPTQRVSAKTQRSYDTLTILIAPLLALALPSRFFETIWRQGLIEPRKAARGHVTAHSANVDGEILIVTKYRLPFLHVTWDILATTAKLRGRVRIASGRANNGGNETQEKESMWFCWHAIDRSGERLLTHMASV